MDEKRYRLPGAPVYSVPADTAERLLALGDGEAALLYIHILTAGGELSVGRAAAALGRSETDIRRAAAALGRAGILAEAAVVHTPPSPELPEYTAGDILSRSQEDPAFKGLVEEAQRVLGHSLSTADLKTLFGIYDQLGIAPAAIMLLMNHCAETVRRRYGPGRRPTMPAIRKEAYAWANREVLTVEQAEEHLAALALREQESVRVRQALQVYDRELTPTERKYLDNWLAMGYGAEALSIAYDRTMVRTGRLAWAYMNKIVLDWYEKGLFTPEEIEKGDGPQRHKPGRGGPAAPAHTPGGDDLKTIEDIFNNTKR